VEVQFTPEQEARLAQIASYEGVEPSRLVRDAALKLIEGGERSQESVRSAGIDSRAKDGTALMHSGKPVMNT
jgi:hypothetical protein